MMLRKLLLNDRNVCTTHRSFYCLGDRPDKWRNHGWDCPAPEISLRHRVNQAR
jgi:hypothetical protein